MVAPLFQECQHAQAHKTVSNLLYLSSRVSAGCLLLIAGAAKLSPTHPLPVATWFVIPKTAVFALGIAEFFLGAACLSLASSSILRKVLVVIFASFVVVLAIQWFHGEERCQCMGSFSAPLGLMAVVDALLLYSFLWFRREWGAATERGTSFASEQISNLRVVLPALLLLSIVWFGSLDSARSYLSGDPLLIDSYAKFAGIVSRDHTIDVAYRLTNYTSEPVSILGAKSSCTCVAILDLPATVQPRSQKEIRMRLTGVRSNSMQREWAELILGESASSILLEATAIVRPNP